MRRITLSILILAVTLATAGPGFSLSERATDYRKATGLSEYNVPKAFLDGYFIANETDPHHIFGPVGDAVKACSCPTAWLIEKGERERIGDIEKRSDPLEFTVYLESDCPEKTSYYVFVVQHNLDPEQWLKWRWQFHKNKAEQEYGIARDRIKEALQDGFGVSGELRFVEVNGATDMRNPEEIVTEDLKLAPVYDLKKGQKISH